MFANLMRRRGANNNSSNDSDKHNQADQEQSIDDGEQNFDSLAYRLQHLSSGINRHSLDPFDVGSDGSSSSDQSEFDVEVDVLKIGAVDDVGWGANNGCGDEEDSDGLFVDFGERSRQKEILSTPRFGGGSSITSSNISRWDSTKHSHHSLSTVESAKIINNDVSSATIQKEQAYTESSNVPTVTYQPVRRRSIPVAEQMISPAPITPKRAQSIASSTLSSLSSPTDQCTKPLPLVSTTFKPVSRRLSSSSGSSSRRDEDNTNKNTNSGNEECPRLEQLQMMSLEELQTELTKIQAQSKANLENSWKAAEHKRVQKSALDDKVEQLRTKLNANDDFEDNVQEFQNPLSRRGRSSGDLVGILSDAVGGMGGMGLRPSRSLANLTQDDWAEERGNETFPIMPGRGISSDVIAAFTLDLESPSMPSRQNNIQPRSSNQSVCSADSSEFGLKFDVSAEHDQTGMHCIPTKTGNESNQLQDFDESATIKIVEQDILVGSSSSKPEYRRRPSEEGELSTTSQGSFPSNNTSSKGPDGGRKRRPSLVRRPSFMSLFGLDSSKAGSDDEATANFSQDNQSVASSTDSPLHNYGNIFQVEARAIMIEELQKVLIEKEEDVEDLIDEIEEQKEESESCEEQISRLRAKIVDEYNTLTCKQSKLQQSVKELLLWDSAVESILDKSEGQRQEFKRRERELRDELASNGNKGMISQIALEQKLGREYNTMEEKAGASLSKIMDDLRSIHTLRLRCDLEEDSHNPKLLFDRLDAQTDKLHNLFDETDRREKYISLKRNIEDQLGRIIKAHDRFFELEADLRGLLIGLKLDEESSNDCNATESSCSGERRLLEQTFAKSVLPYLNEAREEAMFVVDTLTKCDRLLSWWNPVDNEELDDAVSVSFMLDGTLGAVTENIATIQAKIEEEYSTFQRSLISGGISSSSEAKKSVRLAELDHVNAQVSSLEVCLAARQILQKEYALKLDECHAQDEVNTKENLELVEVFRGQLNILTKKLSMDDNRIASLRGALKEKKEQVTKLECEMNA